MLTGDLLTTYNEVEDAGRHSIPIRFRGVVAAPPTFHFRDADPEVTVLVDVSAGGAQPPVPVTVRGRPLIAEAMELQSGDRVSVAGHIATCESTDRGGRIRLSIVGDIIDSRSGKSAAGVVARSGQALGSSAMSLR